MFDSKHISINSKINYFNCFFVLLLSLFLLLLSVYLTGEYALYLLILFNLILFFIVVFFSLEKNLVVLLLSINLIPLAYLNNTLHYVFKWVVIQDIPLFILFALAFSGYLLKEKSFTIRFSGLFLPLLVLTLYTFLSTIIGIVNNNKISFVIDELYHLLYYPFALVLFYLIRQKRHYYFLFMLLIFITVFVSLQYLFFKYLFNLERIVSFQSGLLLFPISYFVGSLLFYKTKPFFSNLKNLDLLFIVLIGLFITLTRSLWLSGLVSVVVVSLVYLVVIRKVRKKTIFAYLILIMVPFLWFGLNSSVQVKTEFSTNKELEYRAQSLSNVSEDASFLMRVELGLYIYKKFIDSPIVGTGLGDKVSYKILTKNHEFIIYPDGSWLYFLWKGGLIGFFLYLWLYIKMFKESLFVLRNSSDIKTKIIILAILGTLSGLILYSQFTAFLVKYKSDIIFSIFIAYLMYESDNIKKIKIRNNDSQSYTTL